ncbi:MAG: DUF2238 domain-containing protein [Pseudomonadota bacterium]
MLQKWAPWDRMTRVQRWLFALGLTGIALARINEPFPQVAFLHHAPTLLFILIFPRLTQIVKLSDKAWLCLFAFLAIHTLGGRYTYTNTPYDAWFEALIGYGLNELMGWERNHYDRLAHFAFGALLIAPVAELWRRNAGLSRTLSIFLGVEFILALSALYEVFEWLLSIVLAPDNVEAYNGQQGDIWDPQKDIALAFVGAIATATGLLWRGDTRAVRIEEKGEI